LVLSGLKLFAHELLHAGKCGTEWKRLLGGKFRVNFPLAFPSRADQVDARFYPCLQILTSFALVPFGQYRISGNQERANSIPDFARSFLRVLSPESSEQYQCASNDWVTRPTTAPPWREFRPEQTGHSILQFAVSGELIAILLCDDLRKSRDVPSERHGN
jgi:hypothetical protein